MRIGQVSLLIAFVAVSAYAQADLQVTGGLPAMVNDYLTGIAKAHWQTRGRVVGGLRTPEAVVARQEFVRARFIQLLGGFPKKSPLNPRTTGILKRDGYHIEKIIFESLPKFYVTADCYVPDSGASPFPAVLGTAGHSEAGKADPVYQRAWISLVRRGFIVLAFDPLGEGERKQYWDPETGRSRVGVATEEHTLAGLQCLLTGTALGRYFVWDGIRALDYLLTRKDVAPNRIAVTGNSGGGTQAAYLAIAEPRLAAAAPSCYLTSSEKLWMEPGPQDAEQNVPGSIRDGLDLADFAFAFAPKPFLFLTATRDFFPIAGAHASFAEAQTIYRILGRPEGVDLFEFDAEHKFGKPQREAMYRWFERWLKSHASDAAEGEFEVEDEAALNCTATGQLATSLGGETVHSLNRAVAEHLARDRRVPEPYELPALVAAHLGIAPTRQPAAPLFSKVGEVGRTGYRIEKITLESEAGITLPALVFVPESGGRKSATIYIQPAGKAADAGEGNDILALVREGHVVLAPDLRGWGESEAQEAYQTAMRAILIGKTMVGMQVTDLLASASYLATRDDVDAARIGVVGKGNGALIALYAAALDPRISRTVCEGPFLSYLEMARARLYEDLGGVLVPGVLKVFDLPDVAAAVAPRPLWIVNPRSPSGAAESLESAGTVYKAVFSENAKQSRNEFRILHRPGGQAFSKFYRAWLDRP